MPSAALSGQRTCCHNWSGSSPSARSPCCSIMQLFVVSVAASALLGRAGREQLLDEGVCSSEQTVKDLGRPIGDTGLAFFPYHKAGVTLTYLLARHLAEFTGSNVEELSSSGDECFYPELQDRDEGLRECGNDPKCTELCAGGTFTGQMDHMKDNTITCVQSPDTSLPIRAGVRVVHMVRDPVTYIISGYRYHSDSRTSELSETKGHGARTDARALLEIFEKCNFNCNAFDLFQTMPASEGVVISALLHAQELNKMFANLQRWEANPEVLHISLEHFRTNFNATVACILDFFSLDSRILGHVQDLDTASPHLHSEINHSQTSVRHDNTELRATLEMHPSWGNQFRAASERLQAVYLREHMMFGCPLPN